ncbi:MAG: DUF2851 family protein [Bacteroidota bacterium]
MREDMLHFIWKYKKLQLENVYTSKNESIVIEDVGTHNHLAGPDFFNARINIDGQLWAGNVEIHLKSSDWYAHHHEKDSNYNNVILHVVWEDDVSVFRKNNTEIPVLELKKYVSENVLEGYQALLNNKRKVFINCEKDLKYIDSFLMQHWLDRLYLERLERKSELVWELLSLSKNDWEKVLFILLLKNFGSKINADSFLSIGTALDFLIVRKVREHSFRLESILFGIAGLLEDDLIVDEYYIRLKEEYQYQKHKFQIDVRGVQKPGFFKLRPANFPTIRLSQVASLYHTHQNLFSQLISAVSLEEIYKIFDVAASPYWYTHFSFGKISRKSGKKLSKKFIDLIVINTILPLKFCYSKDKGVDVGDEIIKIASELDKEENTVVHSFKNYGFKASNAFESQSILQLYNEYCSKNRCLQCAVGNHLLNRNG